MSDEKRRPMGVITISDRAVMQIATHTAELCDGVAEMTYKTKTDAAARAVSMMSDTAGCYIKKTAEGVELDVYIACFYGGDVKTLKAEVASAVAGAYGGTGVKINRVTVHVNSVK